jgi:hypothetical protein
MNRIETESKSAQPGRLDAILASEEAIVPSSGFLAAVMESVQDESRAPAPIPFPWKRAVPGFVLAVAVFGGARWSWCAWEPLPQGPSRSPFHTPP